MSIDNAEDIQILDGDLVSIEELERLKKETCNRFNYTLISRDIAKFHYVNYHRYSNGIRHKKGGCWVLTDRVMGNVKITNDI